MSLIRCYEEALRLTEAQGQAISDDHWDEFENLLQRREACLAEAERAIAQAPQAEKDQARELLTELIRLDEANSKAFYAKKAQVQAELREMNQSQQVRNQYLDSYDNPEDAKFFDQGL